jgi:hypothetical protein
VAGVAAIIRSYFPNLSAKQVKFAIEKSVVEDPALSVTRPGTKDHVSIDSLCASGGFVNAYNAVKLAATLQPEKKEVKKETLPKSTFKNVKVKK